MEGTRPNEDGALWDSMSTISSIIPIPFHRNYFTWTSKDQLWSSVNFFMSVRSSLYCQINFPCAVYDVIRGRYLKLMVGSALHYVMLWNNWPVLCVEYNLSTRADCPDQFCTSDTLLWVILAVTVIKGVGGAGGRVECPPYSRFSPAGLHSARSAGPTAVLARHHLHRAYRAGYSGKL